MILLLQFICSFLLAQTSAKAPYVEVRFVSANKELVRGEDNHLAFVFDLEKDWHIYWKNPGDSGKEPKLEWIETSGLNASKIIWPAPHKMPLETLMNYGYDKKVALPVKVSVPANFAKDSVELKAKLSWLVCRIECIPGKVDLSINLDVKDQTSPSRHYFLVQKSLNQVPLKNKNLSAKFTIKDTINLEIDFSKLNLPELSSAYFYPLNELTVDYAATQRYEFKEQKLILKIKKDVNIDPNLQELSGVITLKTKNPNLSDISYDIKAFNTKESTKPIALLLIFAFIGGLILNLMPCVFPVLSLKVLSFVHQAREKPKSVKTHGWYYTLGVLASFWTLTLILILLKTSGEAVGWGFQLQSPWFVTTMIFLFFFIGLNLLGFFEVGESLSALGGKSKDGYFNSFQTGILATIVATPCTAPFMGVAIGSAFTMPFYATFTIFTALALGMAFPYLLLAYFPQLLIILPKPGLWMKKLKEVLAFPMFLTMLWLLWVLQQQTSSLFIFIVLFALISLLFLFWLHQYYPKLKILLLTIGTFIMATTFIQIPSNIAQVSFSNAKWEAYSEDKLQEYLAAGKAVFIDFTASWCITCQVNKRLVLNTDEIQNFFVQNNIRTIKADWTNNDPAITNKLAEFGRNSVPLYVYYAAGSNEAKILPEILSKNMILGLKK